MPIIRPISDLRNHSTEISDICHNEDQPIFITKNGKSDLVVMSQAHYDRLQRLFKLYQKLGEAEILDASGDEGISHEEAMDGLRNKFLN